MLQRTSTAQVRLCVVVFKKTIFPVGQKPFFHMTVSGSMSCSRLAV